MSLEVWMFSLAVGNRMNVLQAENLRLVREQNQILEQKVEQRTQELSQTLETVAQQKDAIISSINYALRIQNAILPSAAELQKHFDCFVFFRPRDIVSGDFYWFAEKEGFKIIAVADCTGHGVSGAFMTMIGNDLLNQIVHDQEIHEPAEILKRMQQLLEKTLSHSGTKIKDGMEMLLLKFEIEEGRMVKAVYAGAKSTLYYVQNGELHEIAGNRKAIGEPVGEGFAYKEHALPLSKGPLTLYLRSDGYQDQFGGEQGKKFMLGKLKKMLQEIADLSMPEQQQYLASAFDAWKGSQPQTDDVLLIGIKVGT
jgi:serine phosphatase RsbU (regulator of sigma subunit)